jgi:hypothetical protein
MGFVIIVSIATKYKKGSGEKALCIKKKGQKWKCAKKEEMNY